MESKIKKKDTKNLPGPVILKHNVVVKSEPTSVLPTINPKRTATETSNPETKKKAVTEPKKRQKK